MFNLVFNNFSHNPCFIYNSSLFFTSFFNFFDDDVLHVHVALFKYVLNVKLVVLPGPKILFYVPPFVYIKNVDAPLVPNIAPKYAVSKLFIGGDTLPPSALD
jgi:hypothetical protein